MAGRLQRVAAHLASAEAAHVYVAYELSDGVATITLDRAEQQNRYNVDFMLEVKAAIRRAERDVDVRAIVLTAAGEHFCQGADRDFMRLLGTLTPAEKKTTVCAPPPHHASEISPG